MDHADNELKAHAITLAGLWNTQQTRGKVLASAKDESLAVATRAAAFGAVANMKLPEGLELLAMYAAKPHASSLRAAAVAASVSLDASAAARFAVELLSVISPSQLLDLIQYLTELGEIK
jgi:hypothetical protein